VVVAVGLTLVEPLAEVAVNVPGVMATFVAPEVAQLSVVLEPELMLVGLAVNELIAGLLGAFTVTVRVDAVEPAELVAVSVYVVVAVGLKLVEPLAEVDVNVPGVIVMLVAPVAAQLSVLFALAFMVAGLAIKDVICGTAPFPGGELKEVPETQPTRPAQRNKVNTRAQIFGAEQWSSLELSGLL
jgi:hypothetical protein